MVKPSKPVPKGKAKRAFKIGRSAVSGKFMPVEKAKKQPSTSVVETVKKPRKK